MLVKVVNDLLLAVDCGYAFVLILVDLRAAFATVSTGILMVRLGKMVRQT